MLDLLVGLGAALLVLAGVAVVAGPALPRRIGATVALLRHLADRAATATATATAESVSLPVPHATSQRAMLAAARLAGALGQPGQEELAADLRYFARRLAVEEREGLSGLWATARRLEGVRLPGAGQARFEKLLQDLRRTVSDRAEQLELLPFR
ncbi:MAG: hypothetical protein ACREPA_11795 [Candidatus Dormibacteraceae bacterium]